MLYTRIIYIYKYIHIYVYNTYNCCEIDEDYHEKSNAHFK